MFKSAANSWDRVREMFAEQFEPHASNFVYRKSQKGQAISVSADDRSRFIYEFDRNLRRAQWILYCGLVLAFGGIIGFSLLKGSDLSQAAMFVGIGLATIPYFAYYRWAWGAPARELGNRTPIAGERSPDEVRRLRFQRMTYRQLAVAAFGGVIVPFIGSSGKDVLAGWNRLWLAFGGALVLFAAVQAFRKCRFEQEDSYLAVMPYSSNRNLTKPSQDAPAIKDQLWRYVPLAVILLGLVFIGFTSEGKQLAKQPSFVPIVMIAVGSWSLITATSGFLKGQIQPFARGFYNTYQRDTQPKRFWTSLAWNAIFGCFCLWVAFAASRDAIAQPLQDRCYNEGRKYQPQNALSACNQLLDGKASLGGWSRADIFVDRGIAYADLGRPESAIADYTTALRLEPNYPEAYYDRGLAYEDIGDVARAIRDYGTAIQQDPRDADPYFSRGLLYLNMSLFDDAISDFTRSHGLDPKDAWSLANRGLAYAWKRDSERAEQDFAAARALDPSNYVVSHGEAVLSMQLGDTHSVIDHLNTALRQNPNDTWALQRRAEAYRRLGESDNADADLARLRSLSGRAGLR